MFPNISSSFSIASEPTFTTTPSTPSYHRSRGINAILSRISMYNRSRGILTTRSLNLQRSSFSFRTTNNLLQFTRAQIKLLKTIVLSVSSKTIPFTSIFRGSHDIFSATQFSVSRVYPATHINKFFFLKKNVLKKIFFSKKNTSSKNFLF